MKHKFTVLLILISGNLIFFNLQTSLAQTQFSNVLQFNLSDWAAFFNTCINNRDVNQDGVIDATDVRAIDNYASAFVTGYVSTDVTGDDVVNATDEAIVDNNAVNFVMEITP